MSVIHKIASVEPWFGLICEKIKRIDGRCGEKYETIKSGDVLELTCKSRSVWFRVVRVTKYASFPQLLRSEKLQLLLPGVATIEEGLKVYQKFYSPEFECTGVYAFELGEII